MTEWVRMYRRGADYLECLGGVDWHEAPIPRWWHRCRAQMRGHLSNNYVERCACGAARLDRSGPWVLRNSRCQRWVGDG